MPVLSTTSPTLRFARASAEPDPTSVFKHTYEGNWKLVLENHLDGVHPNHVHISSVHVAREVPDPGQPEKYSDISVRQMRQNGAPEPVWEAIGMWTSDWGHGYMGDYHSDGRLVVGLNNPVFADYRARLEQRVGAEEAQRILGVTRWNTIVYPNVSFMSQFRQLRIVHPLAVNKTVVYTYNLRPIERTLDLPKWNADGFKIAFISDFPVHAPWPAEAHHRRCSAGADTTPRTTSSSTTSEINVAQTGTPRT